MATAIGCETGLSFRDLSFRDLSFRNLSIRNLSLRELAGRRRSARADLRKSAGPGALPCTAPNSFWNPRGSALLLLFRDECRQVDLALAVRAQLP